MTVLILAGGIGPANRRGYRIGLAELVAGIKIQSK